MVKNFFWLKKSNPPLRNSPRPPFRFIIPIFLKSTNSHFFQNIQNCLTPHQKKSVRRDESYLLSIPYTISSGILCVSWEELSLTESNQQIWDFYKRATFEKQRHCGTLYRKFLISVNYSFNVMQIAVVTT